MCGDMTTGQAADSARSQHQSATIDRRSALKKAAVAAGVAAWTTPVVQVVSPGTAHAQTVTGCSPVVTITLSRPERAASACPCPTCPQLLQSDTVYWVQGLTVDCGPTCRGRQRWRARSSSQTSASPRTAPTSSASSPAWACRLRSAPGFRSGAPTGGSTCSTGRSPPYACPAPGAGFTAADRARGRGAQRRGHDVDDRSGGAVHERGGRRRPRRPSPRPSARTLGRHVAVTARADLRRWRATESGFAGSSRTSASTGA